MSINKNIFFLSIYFFTSSCVTFNNIRVQRPLKEDLICAKMSFVDLNMESDGQSAKESELDILSRKKILQVLARFNISETCEVNKLNIQIKIHQKTSKAYEFFLGAWSVVTVLTLGIIPTYSSLDTDIYIFEKNAKVSEKGFHYSSAVWLPFVVKQIKDDSYAFENYSLDSKGAVIGIEIAQMIRSLAESK